MKKLLLVGASLVLLGGMVLAEDGDGKKAIPEGGRGYGFVDLNNDGVNDNFVDANKDGVDDNWVDANKDGVNDLRGTKAGTGAGNRRMNTTQTTRPIMGTGTQSRGGQGQGRGRR